MASMLTGANVLESPARGLLLGDRVLSYSGNVGLTYAHSSRLSFHFSSVSGGGQNRRGGTNGTPEEKIILPRSMAISAGMALSYAFSPRTGIGLNVEESRTINKYQNAYSTSGTASISRKMGMHWFLSVNAGGAITRMTSQSFSGASTSPQVVGGGSLGYQLRTQTFVGTYQRSSSDGFGFAAGANTTATAGWTWRRPGSRWTVFASGGQHQIRGAGFASLSGWETAGGISASLDAHTSLSGQYVYFNSQGSYGGTFNNMIVHSVRVSLGWTPQTAQRH
jgi:hypothetical protein